MYQQDQLAKRAWITFFQSTSKTIKLTLGQIPWDTIFVFDEIDFIYAGIVGEFI